MKNASKSASKTSKIIFRILSISCFKAFYSTESSYNSLPKRTFLLIVSGKSLVLLNLRSTSKHLKYLNKTKGGEFPNSGSNVETISLSFYPNSLCKEALNSNFALLNNELKILSPFSIYPIMSILK